MQLKNLFTAMIVVGILIVATTGVWLATFTPASAQCGSQASSCKNCHEVQGKMPVNNGGAAWHKSHAFGDFCYICHAGNNQAAGEAEAHADMVSPLSDTEASCQQCHPNDLQERAQVYATVLGVELGEASARTNPNLPVVSEPTSVQTTISAPPITELEVDDPNLVNYAQRYNEIVLGKRPINWGNVILIGLIGLIVVGGGGFIITNEKLVKVSFGDTKVAEGEYPAQVVDLLPTIAKLKPSGLKSLKKVLDHPRKAEKVLTLMDAIVSDKNDEE